MPCIIISGRGQERTIVTIFWKLFDQEILAIPMGVTDDDFCGACIEGCTDRCFYFFGHELSKATVFEALRPELITGNNAHNTFHVGRNVDLELPGLSRCGHCRCDK